MSMCVLCVCASTHVHICAWSLVVSLGCHSSGAIYTLDFETGSLINLELTNKADHSAARIYLLALE